MNKMRITLFLFGLLLFSCADVLSQVDENVFRNINSKKPGITTDDQLVKERHLNFNAGWRFQLGEIPGFFAPEFDDAGWRVLDVPHDWSVEGQFAEVNQTGPSGGYLPIGIGCYRKHFVLPEGSKGKRIKVRFDGVYMNSSVYLNGIYLGNRPYGFSTFEYDLTPFLLGAENYLTLKNWLAVRDNPYVVGLFLWVGIDYLGESLGWPRRGWEWGLIDIGGFEKAEYYYWQAFWSEKPMVHIAVNLKVKDDFEWRSYNVASHWNFNPGDVDTVLVYSNAEKVELYQNGKSLGKKPVDPDTYQAIYLVNYKKGELTAKAFNKKEMVATHTLKTAGEPKKLVLKEEWKSESTESDRLIFLTLEIQDEKGTRCPFAKNEVTIDVSGAGELIGLDSGNQFSHELYKQNKREAHEGRLLLTIRPKGKGSISVQCRAGGLGPAANDYFADH